MDGSGTGSEHTSPERKFSQSESYLDFSQEYYGHYQLQQQQQQQQPQHQTQPIQQQSIQHLQMPVSQSNPFIIPNYPYLDPRYSYV